MMCRERSPWRMFAAVVTNSRVVGVSTASQFVRAALSMSESVISDGAQMWWSRVPRSTRRMAATTVSGAQRRGYNMNCWPLITAAVKAGETVILSVPS